MGQGWHETRLGLKVNGYLLRGIAKMSDPAWHYERFIGIDFSGSATAGRSIWIATGTKSKCEKEGGATITVEDCLRAEALSGSGRNRERSHAALQAFIEKQKDAVIGIDFPFGLPRSLVNEDSWERFIYRFPDRFSSPRHFREVCFQIAGNYELKRKADEDCKAPFSPYNLRVYRQTYYGIRDVLYPLLNKGTACILPMQKSFWGLPWVVEVCPASTLKAADRYSSYKGKGENKYQNRLDILQYLEKTAGLTFPDPGLREKILQDPGGDALDSVIALFIVSGQKGFTVESGDWMLEGYTYY